MKPILEIKNLNKTYGGGFEALKNVNLNINRGEIFALLGPNGAGKTTLINIICGIVNPTSGEVHVDGFDILKDYRKTRSLIGLVPQELVGEAFETVSHTINFSRGLFGKAPNNEHVEKIIKELSLWDKKDNRLMTLSGGMKRRVMIAKALSHEPKVLFLDEPTAGVDVSLRQDMWENVKKLRDSGVTIILTTHYIEEAEEMADRIGVINNGQIILTEEKNRLVKKMGKRQLVIDLNEKLTTIPEGLKKWDFALSDDGLHLIYTYDSNKDDNGISDLFLSLCKEGVQFKDLHTSQSSLEEIFVELVKS